MGGGFARDDAARHICSVCGKEFAPKNDEMACAECAKKSISDVFKTLNVDIPPVSSQSYDEGKAIFRGGGVDIWRVRKRETGNIYALKMLQSDYRYNKEARNALLAESEIGKALCHENIVRTIEIGDSGDGPYHLMELCEGGNVGILLRKHEGKLPLTLATRIMLQVLSALDYMHNAKLYVKLPYDSPLGSKNDTKVCGVVHRDITLNHMLLAGDPNAPTVKLTGFETAGYFCEGRLFLPHYDPRKDDHLLGSVGFARFTSRQQALNHLRATPATDLWMAAAAYYYVLAKAPPKPFREFTNPWGIVISEPPVPILERDDSIPAPLAEVIDRTLADQQELFYNSAAALRRDIIAALPHEAKNGLADLI